MTDYWRAESFVDQFSKAVNLMMEHAPKDMSICFSVYARDPLDRTDNEPDGKMFMSSAKRCWYYDHVMFKEYVSDFYSSNSK